MFVKPRFTDTPAIRDAYDRWSQIYDHDQNPLPALELPIVQQVAGSVHGESALDLGCGTGRHALWLADGGAQVTAVDFSEGMLMQARSKRAACQIDFHVHDLNDVLPFDSGIFDLLVSGLVLEHIQDLQHFFSEVFRVAKPGGRAVVSTMHPAMFLRDSQARFTDPESGATVEPGSHSHQTSEIIMAALANRLELIHLSEHAPSREFAAKFPRCEKYVGWPMLLVLGLRR